MKKLNYESYALKAEFVFCPINIPLKQSLFIQTAFLAVFHYHRVLLKQNTYFTNCRKYLVKYTV